MMVERDDPLETSVVVVQQSENRKAIAADESALHFQLYHEADLDAVVSTRTDK